MSSTLTKKQVSAILNQELNKTYLALQVLALLLLVQTIVLLLFGIVFGLIGIVALLTVYLEYKRVSNKINELKNKYGEK